MVLPMSTVSPFAGAPLGVQALDVLQLPLPVAVQDLIAIVGFAPKLCARVRGRRCVGLPVMLSVCSGMMPGRFDLRPGTPSLLLLLLLHERPVHSAAGTYAGSETNGQDFIVCVACFI